MKLEVRKLELRQIGKYFQTAELYISLLRNLTFLEQFLSYKYTARSYQEKEI
jgi:hypothetical protein